MIKVKTTVKEIGGENYKEFRKKQKQLRNSYVTIGVHEDAGAYPGGQMVVEVALWNEYGTEKTPERSWMRSAIDENEAKLNEWKDEILENILSKGWSVRKGLEVMGLRIQILLQNKIKSNIQPEYGTGKSGADAVEIARRQAAKQARVGHSETLRESELLLRSITYKVFIRD